MDEVDEEESDEVKVRSSHSLSDFSDEDVVKVVEPVKA